MVKIKFFFVKKVNLKKWMNEIPAYLFSKSFNILDDTKLIKKSYLTRYRFSNICLALFCWQLPLLDGNLYGETNEIARQIIILFYRCGKRFNDDFVFERIWAIQWILVALSCDPVDLSLRYFVSKFVWAWINVNGDGNEIYALLNCVNNSFIVVILCFS